MNLQFGSLTFIMAVTLFVLLFVAGVPRIDVFICRKLKVDPRGGISKNPEGEKWLKIRKALILTIFGIYIAALLVLTFFSSRETEEVFLVQNRLFEELKVMFDMDKFMRLFIFEGVGRAVEYAKESWSKINIFQLFSLAEMYLNICLFIPMGYLLPYAFKWFRNDLRVRPVLACFVFSFIVENAQLLTMRGLYDVNDIFNNTIGGILGVLLFAFFAYKVTNPDWKNDMKRYRRWKKHAQFRTLYPFARRLALSRVTINASSEEEVYIFYVKKMGFMPVKQIVSKEGKGTDYLFLLGRSELEIHCSNEEEDFDRQYVNITVNRLEPIKKRLERHGIQTSDIMQDKYRYLRSISFEAPDNVLITLIEK
ncbi:MAG: VanZ family protein [Lachnospiraceae bacterium]|nr:VanZ family protein [Lachnospiraceae bacterium]